VGEAFACLVFLALLAETRQAEACPIDVEILRIMLCASCATLAEAEEEFRRAVASQPICGELSSQSSKYIFVDAQAKRIPGLRCAPFPHFHSDGYYCGLYPSYKTGYSNLRSSRDIRARIAEEIQRWNSV
jgi:hypothetical protein